MTPKERKGDKKHGFPYGGGRPGRRAAHRLLPLLTHHVNQETSAVIISTFAEYCHRGLLFMRPISLYFLILTHLRAEPQKSLEVT